MSEPNPLTVYVAENAALAEAVIQLLASSGIAAEIAQLPPAPISALTGMSEESGDEFPIVVTVPAQLKEAKELLTSAENVAALRAVREKRAMRTGTVNATCEDCGKPSDWPASVMGTTEICPHCAGYMDIPDPDEDWSDMDFGEPEGEGEANE